MRGGDDFLRRAGARTAPSSPGRCCRRPGHRGGRTPAAPVRETAAACPSRSPEAARVEAASRPECRSARPAARRDRSSVGRRRSRARAVRRTRTGAEGVERLRFHSAALRSGRAATRRHDAAPARTRAPRRAAADSRAATAGGDSRPSGFAYLEVSGGGCFDAAVRRGVESPWERIRAIHSRTKTPLAMALRSLPRRLPAGRCRPCPALRGLRRRKRHRRLPSPRSAQRRLEPSGGGVRHHRRMSREFDAGLVCSPTRTEDTDLLVEHSRRLPELGAARVLVHDPSGSLTRSVRRDLVGAVRDASGLPVGLYCQGAGGVALAATLEAARPAPTSSPAPSIRSRSRSIACRRSLRRRRSAASVSIRASTSTAPGRRRISWTSSSATNQLRRPRRAWRCSPHSTGCRRARCGARPPPARQRRG